VEKGAGMEGNSTENSTERDLARGGPPSERAGIILMSRGNSIGIKPT